MNFGFSASYIALWVIVAFQALVIVGLLRQLAELGNKVKSGNLLGEDWLPAGTLAPAFSGSALGSGRRIDRNIFEGRGGMILFVSSLCPVCKDLAAGIQQADHDSLPQMVAFCIGRESSCARFLKRIGDQVPLLLEKADETASRYHVSGFPTVVIMDGEKRILSYGHPQDVNELQHLWDQSLGRWSPQKAQCELSEGFVTSNGAHA